jgi:hypothetical protein
MAIKKTAKMSAAPKKVASKKSDPGKGFVTKVYSQSIKTAKSPSSKSYVGKVSDYMKTSVKESKAKDNLKGEMSKDLLYKQLASQAKKNSEKQVFNAADSVDKYRSQKISQLQELSGRPKSSSKVVSKEYKISPNKSNGHDLTFKTKYTK